MGARVALEETKAAGWAEVVPMVAGVVEKAVQAAGGGLAVMVVVMGDVAALVVVATEVVT